MHYKKILVTGVAGFIGYHLVKELANFGSGVQIVGLDNINDYYSVSLKLDRLKELGIDVDLITYGHEVKSYHFISVSFIKLNLEDKAAMNALFSTHEFDIVINLAAQAGVRYSIENPQAYIDSNIIGFFNILECCRHHNCKILFYASSSSVYGNDTPVPFSEAATTNMPVSLYAVTKKSNELMASTYKKLYGIETVGLRFFTVYGPWGRPDMAPMLFAKAIMNNKPIRVFNNGNLRRDFTYIDDIINGIVALLQKYPLSSSLYNIGNSHSEELIYFISILESAIGKKAVLELKPMQLGDVYETYADVSLLHRETNYVSKTNLKDGITKFINWYKTYYKIAND